MEQHPQELLRSAWATNGTVGFFVDVSGSRGNAISLYETAWWSRSLTKSPNRRSHNLDRSTVQEWLLPILYGSSDGELADTAGMPELAVIDSAIELAINTGVAIDSGKVARRIESLRTGSMYRSDMKDNAPSWGNTAVAMKALRSIRVEPPAAVVSAAEKALMTSLDVRKPDDLVDQVIPLMAVMDEDARRRHSTEVAEQLSHIKSELPSMSALDRVTSVAMIRNSPLGPETTAWPSSLVCKDLLVTPQGAAFTKGRAADSRLTANAVDAGCLSEFEPPPWMQSGWPSLQSVTSSPQASVAGLRIAKALSMTEEYRKPLTAQLTQTWLPALQSAKPDGVGNLVSVNALIGLLNADSKALPSRKLGDVHAAIQDDKGLQGIPLLLSAWAEGARLSPPASVDSDVDLGANIFVAAREELKFRLTGSEGYRARATSVLQKLAIGDGTFRFEVKPGNTETNHASPIATAIAAWITQSKVDVESLRGSGACTQDLLCGGLPQNTMAVDTPLLATSAVLTSATGDTKSFPLAL